MVADEIGSPRNDAAQPATPGVTYSTVVGAPGRFFRCLPYRATISTTACAGRWRAAQRATGTAAVQTEKCRTCPIGAAHAGESVTYFSPLHSKSICCRCGRGSVRRLIGRPGRLCISCYNRELEFRRGRNAKGNPPEIKLARRTIRYSVEGDGVQTLTLEHSADLVELMVTVLRKTRGRIAFAFNGGRPTPLAAVA